MTKPKKKSAKKPKPAVVRERYQPSASNLAFGSAIGAAIGSLFGTALVRNPNLVNDLMSQFGGMVTNPTVLQYLANFSGAPTVSAAPVHTAGPCAAPGCPSNNPHAIAEEEARVSQENPSWSYTQVQAEVAARLNAQIEAAHAAAEPPKRSRSKKKNSEPEPEDTPN